MASNKADALAGLLSGVGGIDGSLFRKPQAMKEMRPGSGQKQPEQIPAMAAKPQQPPALGSIPSRPSMPQSSFAPSVPTGPAVARPPAPAARQSPLTAASRPESGATSRASSVSSQREVDSAYEQSLLDAFSAKGAVTNRPKYASELDCSQLRIIRLHSSLIHCQSFSSNADICMHCRAMRPAAGTASAKSMESSSISESRLRPASGHENLSERPAGV